MDKTLILREIKEHYNFKSDAEFARFLGISAQSLKHWYTRCTYDIHILATKCKDINAYWLATGEGEMTNNTNMDLNTTSSHDFISIPKSVWSVISNQAESLKAKDAQASEIIEMLKEQLKKSQVAEKGSYAASLVVEDDE